MTRMPAILLAALLAAAPLSAAAQDRGDRAEARRENRAAAGGAMQDRGGSENSGDRGQSGGQRERPSREQSEAPRVSMGAAVQRASSGRPGRFLGASNRGDTIVVRWEYPGGRVADIMVDGRTGRVIGER
jgi:hypothetical protein